MTLNMADMAGPGMQMSPEAAAALKDVRMMLNGTSCIAKARCSAWRSTWRSRKTLPRS